MKIVIVHLDFSAYFTARLLSFQNYLKVNDELHILEILGTSPLYPFLNVSKRKLNNYELLMPNSTYDTADIKEMGKLIKERLNKLQPDVILAGPLAFPSSATALKWAKKNNKGIILFDDCHKDTFIRSKLNTYVKKYLYACVDAFFCPSEDYTESYMEWGFKESQIFYGLNVIDNDFWWYKGEYLYDIKNSYFLVIGRQVPFKNLEGFINAYLDYQKRGGYIPIIFVGNGPEHEKLIRIAKDNPLIKFETFKKPEELKELYKNARALFVPSFKTETWGLVVNEAMCAGKAVAVSKECGCANTLVRNKINGWVFDPHNHENMVEVLNYAQNITYENLIEYGKNSQDIIKDWNLNKFCSGLYSSMIYANTHHKKYGIISRILLALWNGRLNKMERV